MTTIAAPEKSSASSNGVVLPDRPSMSPPSTTKPATTGPFHIPSLDGIRAVAVVLVFLGHLGTASPGGLGVTVFFFLSGFLITSLLRREYERTGTISFRKFYLRRLLRIWPPLYITLGVMLLICNSRLLPVGVEVKPFLFQVFHVTNYYQIFGSGHFMPGTSVLWSLAVEEHFYLLFPFLLFGLFKLGWSRRRIGVALAGICALVLLWRCVLIYGLDVPHIRTYKGTDTRFDSILLGCVLALIRNPSMDAPLNLGRGTEFGALFLSMVAIAATLFIRGEHFRETFRYSLQGIALFPLFYLAVARCHWPIFRWLEWPIMRAFGALSYVMYLVHYSFTYVCEGQLGPRPLWQYGAVTALVIVCFAIVVHFAVERPCGRLRQRLHS